MKYIIDIDGTLCTQTHNGEYTKAKPHKRRISQVNDLYDQGDEIHLWTARGGNSGKDWSELTKRQIEEWGVKHHSLSFKKPAYDIWIDDKAINAKDFFYDIDNRI